MHRLFMLIGLPGVGKSTWVKHHLDSLYDNDYTSSMIPVIASSDDYIEQRALSSEKTYNEVFQENIKFAQRYCEERAYYGITQKRNVIWDQTNLSMKTRKKRIEFFPPSYEKIAVFITCSDVNEWERRLGNRPGKTIPKFILDSMAKQLEYPSLGEGFNSIIEWKN